MPTLLLLLLALAAACANRDKPAMASDSVAPVTTTPVAPSLTVGPEGVGSVRVGARLGNGSIGPARPESPAGLSVTMSFAAQRNEA